MCECYLKRLTHPAWCQTHTSLVPSFPCRCNTQQSSLKRSSVYFVKKEKKNIWVKNMLIIKNYGRRLLCEQYWNSCTMYWHQYPNKYKWQPENEKLLLSTDPLERERDAIVWVCSDRFWVGCTVCISGYWFCDGLIVWSIQMFPKNTFKSKTKVNAAV